MAGKRRYSLAPVKKSSSAPEMPTLFSYGESLSMNLEKMESIARCSATKDRISRQNLFAKRTRLLILSGLVKGITHTSIREQLGAAIRDTALWPLDGGEPDDAPKKEITSSLSVSR